MSGLGLLRRTGDAPGQKVEEPAGSDGEVAPGAGVTLHELGRPTVRPGTSGLASDEDCVAAYRDGIRWEGWTRNPRVRAGVLCGVILMTAGG